MTSLDQLGPRICILGPSNSGKSTLADTIGRSRGLPVVHLDQLHHLPNTDWRPRPIEDFIALHDAAIAESTWVMDGNYSRQLPQRLARATGFIVLEVSTSTSLFRYFRRSWFERDRHGGLEGARDSVKWEMIHYIVSTARQKRARHDALFAKAALPGIRLTGSRALNDFYRAEGLLRRPATTLP